MAPTRNDIPPPGGHEQRAVDILLLAKAVADEIDVLRHTPAADTHGRAQLADSLDRLCNLISLALAEIDDSANAEFSETFHHTIDDVRSRLFQLSVTHMLDKLQRLHRRAATAMTTHTYPLGLAEQLTRAYGSVAENITALGGDERLGEEERRFLDETLSDIQALAEIETELFHFVDFDKQAQPSTQGPPPVVTAPSEPPPTRTPPPSTHGYKRSWGW